MAPVMVTARAQLPNSTPNSALFPRTWRGTCAAAGLRAGEAVGCSCPCASLLHGFFLSWLLFL